MDVKSTVELNQIHHEKYCCGYLLLLLIQEVTSDRICTTLHLLTTKSSFSRIKSVIRFIDMVIAVD